jgi:hypothetical protein
VTWLLPSRGFLSTFLALAALSCGSSSAPEAKSPDAESEAPDAEEEGSGSESTPSSEPSDDDAAAPETQSPAGSCADGSCFSCGSGVCPSGFYCDESAQGGPGCGWLPTCAPKATCGCIEKVLPDCSCTETDGAPHVKCGFLV